MKKNEQIISDAVAKVRDFPTLETAALEAARATGVSAPEASGQGFAHDLKNALLTAAAELGLNLVAAEALIIDGLNKGAPQYAIDQAGNAVEVAIADAVRAIERNRTTDQLAASVCALIKERGLKPDEIDKGRLLSALSSEYSLPDEAATRQRRNALDAALAAASETDKSQPIPEGEGNQPLDYLLRALEAVARPQSLFIPRDDFERLMLRAEALEREGRVLLPVEIEDGPAMTAEIEAIRKNPTLPQLRISSLRVAESVMYGRHDGNTHKKSAAVGSKEICLEIVKRLAAVLAEATATAYTAPAKPTPFVTAEQAEAEAQAKAAAEAERDARIAAEKAAAAEAEAKRRGGPRIRLNEQNLGVSIEG